MGRLDSRVVTEIKRCKADFLHFCRHLKIVNKAGELIPFTPNAAQVKYQDAVAKNPWLYVLKARQLGLTTVIAAHNFWKALLTPNHRVLVMAHTHEASENIFRIYRRFYEHLPAALKFDTTAANVRELVFSHGGMIKVTSASSGSARGSTYNSIHCSEFAFYKDINETIASAFQTASDSSQIVLETTANGINEAHKMWFDSGGYDKLFIAWTDDAGYVTKKKPNMIPPVLKDYQIKYELSDEQYNWAIQTFFIKCASDWNTFRQEYPLTPEQAFVTSGARFFAQTYPHVELFEGYRQYEEPQPYHLYSIGADTASGSPVGDYSAFCTIDVTDKEAPRIVSTYYDRVKPSTFARFLLEEAAKYEALVTVESNSYGLSILEYLTQKEWAYLYRRTKYDKMGDRWTESLGFSTTAGTRGLLLSRLQEYTSNTWLTIRDDRLKYEINTFMFNDSGKPEAPNGKHDDMIFATALALIGMDQLDQVQEVIQRERPRNIKEMLQFERSTGSLYMESIEEFPVDEEMEGDSPLSSLLS
jgi:hypothetical protein